MRSALVLLVSAVACGGLADRSLDPPEIPLQFTATVEVTAHLVDRTKDYPPWLRVIHISYDYINKRAHAAVEKVRVGRDQSIYRAAVLYPSPHHHNPHMSASPDP